MNPVRSRGSSNCGTFYLCFTLVDRLQKLSSESEPMGLASAPVEGAQAPLEAELLTGQASYLPAKATSALADAIVSVLKDVKLSNSLKERGLARSRLFTWEKTADETVSLYESLFSDAS